MKYLRKLFHPLLAFIAIQLAWILVVFFWIYWFVVRHKEFRRLAEKYRPDIVGTGYDWLVLAEGILLLLVILVGVYIIFVYWSRQARLYKQQKNFISQVTHELKSPLASIQLHLETIKMRGASQEQLNRFVDTMLADAGRLNDLISNLLTAAKVEQRRHDHHIETVNLSEFLSTWVDKSRKRMLPANIHTDIEENISAAIDPEEMETVLRNLLENAALYCGPDPKITISLKRGASSCQLIFKDNGRGIEPKEQKRIFKMFYRIRRPGDKTKGTGLGLYIVKNIITEHRGKITVSSDGSGLGTTFTITLPMVGA